MTRKAGKREPLGVKEDLSAAPAGSEAEAQWRAWALAHGEARGSEGLRMDTWASNDTLTAFYRTRGFGLVGTRRIPLDSPLSEHYRGIELALLERSLKDRR